MSTNWGPDDLERLHQADEEAEQERGGSGAILWLAIALLFALLAIAAGGLATVGIVP